MGLAPDTAMLVFGGCPARERPTGLSGVLRLNLWKDWPRPAIQKLKFRTFYRRKTHL